MPIAMCSHARTPDEFESDLTNALYANLGAALDERFRDIRKLMQAGLRRNLVTFWSLCYNEDDQIHVAWKDVEGKARRTTVIRIPQEERELSCRHELPHELPNEIPDLDVESAAIPVIARSLVDASTVQPPGLV